MLSVGFVNNEREKFNVTTIMAVLFAALVITMASCHWFFAAEDIFVVISSVMKDAYGKIAGISTGIAVVCSAFLLIKRMLPFSARQSEQVTSQIAAVWCCWLILNGIGALVAFLQPLIAAQGWN